VFFNSLDFALFLPIVFILYWFVTKHNLRLQNLLIVVASYVFYGWWDWRFLGLIIFSTLVDFLVGWSLSQTKNQRTRRVLLYISIAVNLGFLGFFKYYNFFLDNFIATFSLLGTEFNATSLQIILPVGISFYTFQTLSYTIDVYKGKLTPTRNFIAFSAFVSFFPQLVAGPIERASNLLPQFFKKRIFSHQNAVDGLRQILWGLLKKIVIADNCAVLANTIFSTPEEFSSGTLILGAVFFTFQIYGDFSGYSDIAIGTARLFGFNLMQNFAFPYFSRDIAEFWRRWHISLSTWFRDYLYIPLGGSRVPTWKQVRNTFIIFIVSGFWHGANWTFVAWGALNAAYFLPLLLAKKNRQNLDNASEGRFTPSFKEGLQIIQTFILTTFAWIFFRAESLSHAFEYFDGIFSLSIFTWPDLPDPSKAIKVLAFILTFMLVEWYGRNEKYAIEGLANLSNQFIRWIIYLVLISFIYLFGNFSDSLEFIYFQF